MAYLNPGTKVETPHDTLHQVTGPLSHSIDDLKNVDGVDNVEIKGESMTQGGVRAVGDNKKQTSRGTWGEGSVYEDRLGNVEVGGVATVHSVNQWCLEGFDEEGRHEKGETYEIGEVFRVKRGIWGNQCKGQWPREQTRD